MTEREIALEIVKQGGKCDGIGCYECPFNSAPCQNVETGMPLLAARKWLAEHSEYGYSISAWAPKVGDRVKFKEDGREGEGEIVGDFSGMFSVRVDGKPTWGHTDTSGAECDPNFRYWNAYSHNMKLVSPAPMGDHSNLIIYDDLVFRGKGIVLECVSASTCSRDISTPLTIMRREIRSRLLSKI